MSANHPVAIFLRKGFVTVTLAIMVSMGGGDVMANDLFDETQVTTLFAFDQVSIPHSQNLRLEMRSPTKHPVWCMKR